VAKPLLSDDLWAVIEPLLPVRKRRFRFPGRRPLDDRKCLTGILYVRTRCNGMPSALT
jgi:transposase